MQLGVCIRRDAVYLLSLISKYYYTRVFDNNPIFKCYALWDAVYLLSLIWDALYLLSPISKYYYTRVFDNNPIYECGQYTSFNL